MSMNTTPKRVFWFDDRKTPNVADVLEKEEDYMVFRLSFDGPKDKNWTVMESCHAYCITSTRGEVPDSYKGTHHLIERCGNLLVISTTGAGYDPVDVSACTERGVIVVNQTGANAQAVAEHVVAMMLSLGKKIPQTDRSLRTERGVFREVFKGRNAQKRTIGIVGLGHVGRRIAGICAKGIDMRVIAYDPYLSKTDFEERRAIPVGLDELLTQADYVSINCPLTDETRSMIGHRELSLMQPSAFLINTARGGIVDEDALTDILAANKIAGAGVDVWEVEPPPMEHKLLTFENVIATYHTAGVTEDSRHNMAHWNAQQIIGIFNGKRPPRLINPEAWELFMKRFTRVFGFQPSP